MKRPYPDGSPDPDLHAASAVAALHAGQEEPPEVRSNGARSHNDPAFRAHRADRERIYAELQPLIRKLLGQYGGDLELRQDLPGEIYCRFCALYAAYDSSYGIPLRPYLVKGLTTSVYTFVRSQWRRRKREIYLDPAVELRTRASLLDPTRGWDHRLACQEVLHQLPDAICRLPPRQRAVLIGRFYEGRSFEDLAASLGIQTTTARSLLRHGINNLRRKLAVSEGS